MMDNTVKRPVGMTILLVLSLINAILQIFSALGMWLTTPVMSQMLANGELEESMAPFLALMQMDDAATEAFWEVLESRLTINPIYYLFTALLYIGSLVGVINAYVGLNSVSVVGQIQSLGSLLS